MSFRTSLWVLLVGSALVGGCALTDGQKNAARIHGTALETAGELASAEIHKMRGYVIELNSRIVRYRGYRDKDSLPATDTDRRWPMGYDVLQVAKLGNQPLIVKVIDFDDAADPEVLAKVDSALRAAEAWGSALVAVVDYDSEAALEEAGSKLTDSLKGVTKSDGSQLVTDEDADAAGAIVRGVASFFLEKERASALKKLVLEHHELVPELFEVINPMFDLSSTSSSLVALVFASANDLLRVTDGKLRTELFPDGDNDDNDPVLTTELLENRRIILEDYQYAVERLKELDAIHKRSAVAFKNVRSATDNLVRIMKDDSVKINEIQEFYTAVKDLRDHVRVLRAEEEE